MYTDMVQVQQAVSIETIMKNVKKSLNTVCFPENMPRQLALFLALFLVFLGCLEVPLLGFCLFVFVKMRMRIWMMIQRFHKLS